MNRSSDDLGNLLALFAWFRYFTFRSRALIHSPLSRHMCEQFLTLL